MLQIPQGYISLLGNFCWIYKHFIVKNKNGAVR